MTSTLRLSLAAALAASLVACKKKDDVPPAQPARPAPVTAPVAVAAPVTAAPPPSAPVGSPVTAVSNDAKGVVSAAMEALSAGNLDEALRYYADDHEQSFVVAPMRSIRGKEALKGLWMRMRSSFPDMVMRPRRILVSGDTWIVQAVMTGTHKGQFGPASATGKTVGTEAVYFLTAKDGRIKRTVSMTNTAAFMRQLGILEGKHLVPKLPASVEVIKGESHQPLIDVVKKVYELVSKGDQAAISAYTVPELTVTDHGEDGETQLWDEYRKGAEEMRKTVPDFSVTIEESLGIGDWVVTRAVANGTVQHLPSEKGKAKRIQFRFVDVLRFQNGKARQLETYGDNVQLLQQLGLFTPKAPAGQPAAPAGKPSAPAGKPSAPAGSPAAPKP